MNKRLTTTKFFLCILILVTSTVSIAAESKTFDTFKKRIQKPTKTDKIYAGTFAFNALPFLSQYVRSKPLFFVPVYIIFSLFCAHSIAPEDDFEKIK